MIFFQRLRSLADIDFEGNLSKYTEGRNNNLDTIRLIAAFLVLISHAFALDGLTEPGSPFYRNTYGGLGVVIFFLLVDF